MNSTQTTPNKLDPIIKEAAVIAEEYHNKQLALFHRAVKLFFEDLDTKVAAIGWTQYTPYFNDGDICEFSTGEIYLKIPSQETKAVRDSASFGEHWVSSWEIEDVELSKQCSNLEDLLNSFEDLLENVYGEPALIKIDRNGNCTQLEYDRPY